MSKTPLTDALKAQGTLKPGEPGYWKVWGARVLDVLPGDLVMLKYSDSSEPSEYEVAQYAPRAIATHTTVREALEGKSTNLWDQMRPRFLAASGEDFTIGALQPIILFRQGTHHTLADSVN